jgi:hypothetical protein
MENKKAPNKRRTGSDVRQSGGVSWREVGNGIPAIRYAWEPAMK